MPEFRQVLGRDGQKGNLRRATDLAFSTSLPIPALENADGFQSLDQEHDMSKSISKKTPTAGYVYVVEDTTRSLVKVGFSRQPEKRIKTIKQQHNAQGRHWTSTAQADASCIERLAHKALNTHEAYGEWFSAGFDHAVQVCESLLKEEVTDMLALERERGRGALQLIDWLIENLSRPKDAPPFAAEVALCAAVMAPIGHAWQSGRLSLSEEDKKALAEWVENPETLALMLRADESDSIFRSANLAGDTKSFNLALVARAAAWASVAGVDLYDLDDDGNELPDSAYRIDPSGDRC